MHSSCFLHMRSEPYIEGPNGVDLCFGLHGYFDRSTNTTISQHGYNIMDVVHNATDYPGLAMRFGPVTRGFAMSYFWIGELTSIGKAELTTVLLFFYICYVCADVTPPRDHDLHGLTSFLHTCLMLVNITPVSINLAVFVGVRNTIIQQTKEHAGSLPGVKVSPVGALAWLQLLSLFVFWAAFAAALHMDAHDDIFVQRDVELATPSRNRTFAPTADNHAFPYYFHTQRGMNVTSPVTPPSSIYMPAGGSLDPRQAFGEVAHGH